MQSAYSRPHRQSNQSVRGKEKNKKMYNYMKYKCSFLFHPPPLFFWLLNCHVVAPVTLSILNSGCIKHLQRRNWQLSDYRPFLHVGIEGTTWNRGLSENCTLISWEISYVKRDKAWSLVMIDRLILTTYQLTKSYFMSRR